jgi:hypothetical protein
VKTTVKADSNSTDSLTNFYSASELFLGAVEKVGSQITTYDDQWAVVGTQEPLIYLVPVDSPYQENTTFDDLATTWDALNGQNPIWDAPVVAESIEIELVGVNPKMDYGI